MPAVAYQCANCGGELKYSPTTGNFLCEYCGSDFAEADLSAQGQTATQAQVEHETTETDPDVALYICPNCGGEIISDDTTAATQCYYCHSPIVLSGRLSGQWMPKRIIPFAYDKATATDKFFGWCKQKWFLPKGFFNQNQIQNLTGVYFPYWIVDADSQADYTAQGEKLRSWRAGDMRHTEHRVFDCRRSGDVHLEDLIKSALKSERKKMMESVQPFDEKAMVPFSMSYLSGFTAQRRDLEEAELQDEVMQDISFYTKKIMEGTVTGYSSQRETHYHCNTTKVDWEYGLLPVWTLTYHYKEELYYFAMNGHSGKICGKLPVDMAKLTWVALSAAVVVGGLTALIGGIL